MNQTIRGYEIGELLGQGSIHATYRGYQPSIGRDVAVKVIKPEYANQPQWLQHFGQQARLLAQMEHANIVPLYDFWQDETGAYMVMRLMPGWTLDNRLDEYTRPDQTRPDSEAIVGLIEQIASALDYAHQHGIIHRNVKPANILFDDQDMPYLSDFFPLPDIPNKSPDDLLGHGTARFAPAEQWRGEETPASDQYALAITVYRLLTGHYPFVADTDEALYQQHRETMPPIAHTQRSGIPQAVSSVLARALAKNPADRYPTVTAFADALHDAIAARASIIAVGETVKDYEIRAVIAEGGFAVVYRAYQPGVGRDVVLKVIRPVHANRPEFVRRFEVEARLVARLEHMNIVPLYDYWRDDNGAYLVMRWYPRDLQRRLEQGPLSFAEVVRLVDQICDALTVAHQHGVIHRDLKPANILLDHDDNAYLSDFNTAKDIGSPGQMTGEGDIIGTPAYISPEQIRGGVVVPQTDVYALGVVIFELLTGSHPFAGTATGELLVKHLQKPLPPAPDLPEAVNQVIQKATAKNPAERYPTAQSLAEALRLALTTDGDELPVDGRAVESHMDVDEGGVTTPLPRSGKDTT